MVLTSRLLNRDTFSGGTGDLMDEDTNKSNESEESDEFDSPTPDEIDVLDHDPPLDNMDPPVLHSVGALSLYNTDTCTLDNNAHAPGVSNDHIGDNSPHPDQDSPTPPNDEEDDDHGPV